MRNCSEVTNSVAIFHYSVTKYNCESTRLEVVVDDGWPNLVEILEGVDDLHDDRASLLLGHQFILLQVEVQIVAFAVLQHCAEPVRRTKTDQFSSPFEVDLANSCLFTHLPAV